MAGQAQKWILVALLWCDYYVIYIHRNDVFFMFPLLERDLHFSGLELGLLSTVFQWTYSIISPFVGYAGDRFRRRSILIWSALLSTACTALIGAASSSTQIVFLRGFLAISQAASVPAAVALIADAHDSKTRSTATGIYLTSPFAGLLTSGVLGGFLAQNFGWRFSFFAFGSLGLAMTALLVVLLHEPPRTEPAPKSAGPNPLWTNLRQFFSVKTCVAVAAVFTLDGGVRNTVTTWLPLFLYEKLSLNLARAGALSTEYIQSASMLGVVAGGRAGDWSARRNFRGRILVQIIGLLGMAPALYLMAFSSSPRTLSAAMLLYGFCLGLNQANMWPVMFQVIGPSARSTAVGMLNCISGVMAGWLPAAAGSLRAGIGLDRILGVLALFSVASAIIYCAVMIFWLPKDVIRQEE
jgi:predicted MFS family arabinose efflux permease